MTKIILITGNKCTGKNKIIKHLSENLNVKNDSIECSCDISELEVIVTDIINNVYYKQKEYVFIQTEANAVEVIQKTINQVFLIISILETMISSTAENLKHNNINCFSSTISHHFDLYAKINIDNESDLEKIHKSIIDFYEN